MVSTTPVPLLRYHVLRAVCFGVAVSCAGEQGRRNGLELQVEARIPVPSTVGRGQLILGQRKSVREPLLVSAGGSNRVFRLDGSGRWFALTPANTAIRIAALGVTPRGYWIADEAARRVLLFGEDARAYDEIPIPTVWPGGEPAVLGLMNDGFVVTVERSPATSADTTASILSVARLRKVEVLDSLLAVQAEMLLRAAGEGPPVALVQPWHFADIPLLSGDGKERLVFRQRSGPLASSVSLDRHVYGSAWTRARSRKVRFERVPWSEAANDRWLSGVLDDSLAAYLGGRARAELQLRSLVTRPPYLPALRRVVAGGTLLFFERLSTNTGHHWEVWECDTLRGSFVLPPRTVLRQVVDSTVLAVVNSLSGSDTIVVAKLRRTLPGPWGALPALLSVEVKRAH